MRQSINPKQLRQEACRLGWVKLRESKHIIYAHPSNPALRLALPKGSKSLGSAKHYLDKMYGSLGLTPP